MNTTSGSWTDTSVLPDVTYNYNIKGYFGARITTGIGWYADTWNATPLMHSELIFVAGPSTQAAQQARDAATEAKDAALASYGDINYIKNDLLSISGGVIQDSSGTVLTAARDAADRTYHAGKSAAEWSYLTYHKSPQPSIEIKTLSGALATSGTSISAAVIITNSTCTEFTYSINNGLYDTLPANRIINIPLSPGLNSIMVSVKDEHGNIGSNIITLRRL